MISFQQVSKIYQADGRTITALKDVSFEVQPKEFVSIVGRSGAGKTTLFKLLMAEEKPTSGSIFFEGQDVHQTSPNKLPFLRRKMGAIFQDYRLLPSKTAYNNISYIMEVMGAPEEQISEDVPKVLEIVGLGERSANLPEELSGGERQRLAIARALVHQPDIILADEPTGNLDPFHTQEIIRLLLKINEMGTTVVLATHNREIINNISKRVITLDRGEVIRDEAEGKFIL
ncbi:MAG: cell division ATP-binding protein FtsE [Candidatus Nealsonbacteria bacterium]|nr:cell division ATP-binding protein FtsE [Candidatus Nealsonbacteria bacterium]